MIEQYIKLAETKLWTGEIRLSKSLEPAEVQGIVADFVTRSSVTVVGLYAKDRRLFSMHRWSETRDDHVPTPSVQECTGAMKALARLLRAVYYDADTLPSGLVQVVMGRNMGGYKKGVVAPIDALYDPRWEVTPGHMIHARVLKNGGIDTHDEPAGLIRAERTEENIDAIGSLGVALDQHHFAVEAERPYTTALYQLEGIPDATIEGDGSI